MRRPRAWSWSPGTSRRVIAEKMEGPPRFLGDLRERALFSDPGGTTKPGRCGVVTRPSVVWTTSAPAMMSISGLNGTARSLAVYASRRRLPGRHARLAPGCWPALPDGAGYPQGPDERFPLSLPPFPSFSWRTKSLSIGSKTAVSDGIMTRDNSDNCRMALQRRLSWAILPVTGRPLNAWTGRPHRPDHEGGQR
jgi:hypothetical protein